MNDEAMVIHEEVVHVDGEAAHGDVYQEAEEIHYNPIGNLDVILHQQDMDRNLPYSRMHGYDLDDEGPTEELDEDGFTAQENEIFKKVTWKERGAPLFHDLSLADKAVVDGGMSLRFLEPTPCPMVSEPKPKDEDENAHLKKGIKFGFLQEFKIWLSDYAIRNHRPFFVDHSNQNPRHIIKCDKQGYPWKLDREQNGVSR
ncbi:hypothetical protein D1007_17720 [Hordeum vulgare]|nr:hypothetical protein D1007_17720 [Hordeum vulgare]